MQLIAHPASHGAEMGIFYMALSKGLRVLRRERGVASRYTPINLMQILLDHSKKNRSIIYVRNGPSQAREQDQLG
jgi:hypothetical protein